MGVPGLAGLEWVGLGYGLGSGIGLGLVLSANRMVVLDKKHINSSGCQLEGGVPSIFGVGTVPGRPGPCDGHT